MRHDREAIVHLVVHHRPAENATHALLLSSRPDSTFLDEVVRQITSSFRTYGRHPLFAAVAVGKAVAKGYKVSLRVHDALIRSMNDSLRSWGDSTFIRLEEHDTLKGIRLALINNTTLSRFKASADLQRNILKRVAKIIDMERTEATPMVDTTTMADPSLLIDDLGGETETIAAHLDRMKATNDGFSQVVCSPDLTISKLEHGCYADVTYSWTTSWLSKKATSTPNSPNPPKRLPKRLCRTVKP